MLGGRGVFGALFALNLSVHSYLVLAYSDADKMDTSAPGALLVPGISAGNREPWANRLYFDVLYRFSRFNGSSAAPS